MFATSLPHVFARRCRDVAAAILGGIWIGRDSAQVMDEIAGLPVRKQAAFTVVTLGLLLLVSLFAAQFGLLGMAVFGLAVIAIIA